MPYLLLIMEHPDRRQSRPDEKARQEMEQMDRFAEDLKARGVCTASESLRSLSDGVRIAVRAGQRIVADGPFAEAKEMVGGFFLLQCRTRDEALKVASDCPATEWATVEVRELGPCYPG
jgi:hypothetical protein